MKKITFTLLLTVLSCLSGIAQTMTFDSGPSEPGFSFTNWQSLTAGTIAPTDLANPSVITRTGAGTWNATSIDVTFAGGNTFTVTSDQGDTQSFATNVGTVTLVGFTNITTLTFMRDGTGGISPDFDNLAYTVNPVGDTTDPTAVCMNITRSLDAAGSVTITASDVDGGSSDNVGITSSSVSPSTFNCMSVGSNNVTLTVTDAAGNSDTCMAVVTIEDNTNPIANCVAPFEIQLDGSGMASITTADVNNGSSDACGIGGLSVTPSSFNCSNVGANTVTLMVTDFNGNTSSCTTTVTVADNVAPMITCPGNQTGDADAGCMFMVPDYTGLATATDNCTAAPTVMQAPAAGTMVGLGDTTVTLTADDGNGQTTDCMFTLTVADNTAPMITCPGNQTGDADAGCMFMVPDYTGLATATDNCTAAPTVTQSPTAGSMVALGDTTITLTADDGNGQTTDCTFTLTVEDNTAPVWTNPGATIPAELDATGSITLNAANGADAFITATDNCDNTVGIRILGNAAARTFTCADIGGMNTVRVRLRDNTPGVPGNNDTIIFVDVIVEDNIAPTITCVADAMRDTDAGVCQYTVAGGEFDPAFDDNCTTATTTNDLTGTDTLDGAILQLGDTVVTWTVDDGNGQTAMCTTTITVEDNEAPVAVCQNITVDLDENGEATISATDIDGGSVDNCGDVTISIQGGSGTATSSPTIYFTTVGSGNADQGVYQANVDGSGAPALIYGDADGVNRAGPVGVEINTITGELFFAGGNDGVIYNAPLDGTGPITEIDGTNVPCCERHEFEIDYDNNLIYYTTDNSGLGVANLDGSSTGTALVSSVDVIAGITMDKTNNKLYFNNQDNADIGVVDTDGNNLNVNLIDADNPRGVTIDEDNQILYWVEVNLNGIYTAPADGSQAPSLLYPLGFSGRGYGIDFDPISGLLYWTVFNNGTGMDAVVTAPADGSGTPTVLISGILGGIRGIAAGRNIESLGGESTFDFTCDDVGDNTITLEVTDSNGNTITCDAVVTVQDLIPATILSGPSDIFTGTGASDGECATIVDYGDITIDSFEVEDNCGDASTITVAQTSGLGSGAMFPVGTTVEEYTLTDANGNETVFIFEVNITDTTLPLLDCPSDDVIVGSDADGNYIIEDYTATATDNCTAAADLVVTQEPAAGTVVTDPSTTAITVTATDEAGNTQTCTFNLVVDDTLSIEDTTLQTIGVAMYPNPAASQVTLDAGVHNIDKVTVYDLAGRKVTELNVSATSHQLDVSSFSASVYLVQIQSGDTIITKRLIKQ